MSEWVYLSQQFKEQMLLDANSEKLELRRIL